MKAVLMSVKPKWCELIASGKKTIEVRKSRPKIKTPFKCYIYCTSVKMLSLAEYVEIHRKTGGRIDEWRGKVIGEFVCDKITDTRDIGGSEFYPQSCMTYDDWRNYTDYTKHVIWAWHISDLVIYDRPKELGEFRTLCKYRNDDNSCQYEKVECDCAWFHFKPDYSVESAKCLHFMVRPPQSWCYVEELEVEK